MSKLKDLPMENAMLSDLEAMDALGALIQSGAGNHIEGNPMPVLVKISFQFASEFLKQRDSIHSITEEEPKEPESIIVGA